MPPYIQGTQKEFYGLEPYSLFPKQMHYHYAKILLKRKLLYVPLILLIQLYKWVAYILIAISAADRFSSLPVK
jgi:hypothetical protein